MLGKRELDHTVENSEVLLLQYGQLFPSEIYRFPHIISVWEQDDQWPLRKQKKGKSYAPSK